MHEYSLMEAILEDVLEDLEDYGVTRPGMVERMELKIGALEIHSRESFEQAFRMVIQGTLLEGARLVLTVEPVGYACPKCGRSGTLAEGEFDGRMALPFIECPHCGDIASIQGGRGIGPAELIVAEDAQGN